jgi:hypothetical protein
MARYFVLRAAAIPSPDYLDDDLAFTETPLMTLTVSWLKPIP